jgi:hypothetical protein
VVVDVAVVVAVAVADGDHSGLPDSTATTF